MEYRQGRYNLAATVFVPWDCANNCPFCTSKKDYEKRESFSLEEILVSIKKLNSINQIKEFVITGGEPFADISGLTAILKACKKPVYINTTLPKSTVNQAIDMINLNDRIRGVNISRHINYDFCNVATGEEIDKIQKPIRINTVVTNSAIVCISGMLKEFIYKYGRKNRDINIRADYTQIKLRNLKSRDFMFEWLAREFDYLETESCMVCNSDYFSVDDEFICAYHRGLQFSSVTFDNKCYVNDVIVKQNGKIFKDWDCINDISFSKWLESEVTE